MAPLVYEPNCRGRVGVAGSQSMSSAVHTDKKENLIFLIYKEIQNGAIAKSYIRNRKGFLIYEEMRNIHPYMKRPLVIYDFATAPFRIS
jgi:hypothetical protein